MQSKRHFFLLLSAILVLSFIWSAFSPLSRLTWWLEIAPILIALPILIATHQRFEFTQLAYVLMLVHAIILLIGGHYTYAEVPLFNWLRDTFELSRNYYDRVGHFVQGFVPAIIAREILLRNSPLVRGRWLFFIVCSICLSISAAYEFIEWWVAVYEGGAADAFLGTQGDVWDTQWDMFVALLGSIAAQCFLAKAHDKQLMLMNA
ncbi:inner membrane protein YjdF [mine drainage metagenome]|uniref:Inner membrane protein YjdF n=1 Tax=mine drainage metagenome TaxID=410659 RepID=A0A1J5S436_9ZZZZ